MKVIAGSFLGFLLALSVLLGALTWFDSQRAAMHKVGAHVSPTYCQIMQALDFPYFETGERWRCEMLLDENEPIQFDEDDAPLAS